MALLRNVTFKRLSTGQDGHKGYFHEWVKVFNDDEHGSYDMMALVEDNDGKITYVSPGNLTFDGKSSDPDTDKIGKTMVM